MSEQESRKTRTAAEVVAFWREAGPARWFVADPGFDAACHAFHDTYEAAADGALADWIATPDGALALVLLLDQFPRNLFRGTPRAFATDAQAREVAEAAVEAGHDAAIEPDLRHFLYLPFEHAEDLAYQERAVALIDALGDAESLKYAHQHRDVIARFGRFPHRNAMLGRRSTPEELAYLASEDAFRG